MVGVQLRTIHIARGMDPKIIVKLGRWKRPPSRCVVWMRQSSYHTPGNLLIGQDYSALAIKLK